MVFTNEEAAMIEGVFSTYFMGANTAENVRSAYSCVWQHLAADALDVEDYRRISNAVDFAIKNHFCETCNRESQRVLTTILIKATSAF